MWRWAGTLAVAFPANTHLSRAVTLASPALGISSSNEGRRKRPHTTHHPPPPLQYDMMFENFI